MLKGISFAVKMAGNGEISEQEVFIVPSKNFSTSLIVFSTLCACLKAWGIFRNHLEENLVKRFFFNSFS